MDMIAHDLERDRRVVRSSFGEGAAALRLAATARRVDRRWNLATSRWHLPPARRDAAPSERRAHGAEVRAIAPHPVMHGEVRLPWQRSSTDADTGAQIFSAAGLPVVPRMEHYDQAGAATMNPWTTWPTSTSTPVPR